MASLKQKFGRRVKELRRGVGLTQEQMAEVIGIEPPNVSKLESGMHFPQPEKIEKIATVLGVSVLDLFDFEHLQNRNNLIKYINMEIKNFDDNTLELVYKFVYNLKLYKQ